MIQEFKDELQIIFGLHHQLSINHEYVFTHGHFYLSQRWIKHFDSCTLTLYLASESYLKLPKWGNFLSYIIDKNYIPNFYPKKEYMIKGYLDPTHLSKKN
jgi:hypothetical protein